MSIESVRAFFRSLGREEEILEFPASSATVELAAQALGVEGARIAKTLAFQGEGGCLLIVAAGDARVDNAKFKAIFHRKARMLTPEDTLAQTGHPIGGVCPFANPPEAQVYLDLSLQRFATVFPACGSANSAIRLSCDDLFQLAHAKQWVDVCKGWPPLSGSPT